MIWIIERACRLIECRDIEILLGTKEAFTYVRPILVATGSATPLRNSLGNQGYVDERSLVGIALDSDLLWHQYQGVVDTIV